MDSRGPPGQISNPEQGAGGIRYTDGVASRGEVAELADAPDSKSGALHCACGFDPHLRHHSFRAGQWIRAISMMLTIDLPDDKTAPLTAIAQSHGLSAEQYARQVLEDAIEAAAPPTEAPPSKDIEELFAPLRGLNLEFRRNPSTGRPVEL